MTQSAEQINFQSFESELINPLRGHKLAPLEEYVASLLLDASKERPIDNESIRCAIGLRLSEFHLRRAPDQRTVKMIVRALRKDHSFPILASRKRPAGYWWCHSAEEMKDFVETFRSQALDELHTVSRMLRENFPALAGQLRLTEDRGPETVAGRPSPVATKEQ